MDTEKIINNFYDNSDEDNRLTAQSGRVEFIVTTHFIDKYLKSGDRILEVGAGTGRYSLHYAHKGFEVDAVELVQSNLDVLLSHILPTDRIAAWQGNALDLSGYADNTFDVVLVLGPMYHLFTDKDKLKCLSEAHRVAKENGIVFVAYCQFDASMVQNAFMNNSFDFVVEQGMLDARHYLPISTPTAVFELYRKEQIDRLDEYFNWKRLHYVGTDMYTGYYMSQVDGFDKEMYRRYIKYTLTICENPNLVGVSNHTLDILKKGKLNN